MKFSNYSLQNSSQQLKQSNFSTHLWSLSFAHTIYAFIFIYHAYILMIHYVVYINQSHPSFLPLADVKGKHVLIKISLDAQMWRNVGFLYLCRPQSEHHSLSPQEMSHHYPRNHAVERLLLSIIFRVINHTFLNNIAHGGLIDIRVHSSFDDPLKIVKPCECILGIPIHLLEDGLCEVFWLEFLLNEVQEMVNCVRY